MQSINNFTGTLPSLSNLTRLRSFSVGLNQLTGRVVLWLAR